MARCLTIVNNTTSSRVRTAKRGDTQRVPDSGDIHTWVGLEERIGFERYSQMFHRHAMCVCYM